MKILIRFEKGKGVIETNARDAIVLLNLALEQGLVDSDETAGIEERFRESDKEQPKTEITPNPELESKRKKGPILCHRSNTPLYLPVVEAVEKLYIDGTSPEIPEIADVVFGAYEGELTKRSALSYAYKYRAVVLERLKNKGAEKLIKQSVKISISHSEWKKLARINKITIYDEVAAQIRPLYKQGEPTQEAVIDVIRETCGDHLKMGSLCQYASCYMRYIREEGMKEEEEGAEKELDERQSITLCYEPKAKQKEKLSKREKLEMSLLCHHNSTPIYDKILLEILKSPDRKISNILDTIKKESSEPSESTSIKKCAYDYQAFINLLSVDEVKKIYEKIPESFDIRNVRAHISTRFGQSEKRANVTKLAIAILMAEYNCEEVSEGVFRKEIK